MRFFQRLRGMFQNSTYSESTIERVLREFGISSPSLAGESVTPDSAIRIAAVYSCVRVLAESVSQVPLHLYRVSGNRKERATDHVAYRLLNRMANPWQTCFEFRETMTGHAVLRGNAFAYKAGEGQFLQLIPIHPDRIETKELSDGSTGYMLSPANGGQAKPVPASRMVHIRGPFGGMSPVMAYKEAVGLALATQKHQSKTFANGAKFRGYLKHPTKLSDTASKRLRESFDAEHSGENTNKTPLLEEGIEWVKVGMSAEDSGIIDQMKMTRSEIASIFRVPPHMIGDLDRATFSNIEHQSIQFVASSLVPWFRRWELALMRDLLTPEEQETHYFEHLAEALLRGDTQSRFQAYGKAINDGWMSRNEVRSRENLDRVEGLDEYLIPLHMASGENTNENQNQQ